MVSSRGLFILLEQTMAGVLDEEANSLDASNTDNSNPDLNLSDTSKSGVTRCRNRANNWTEHDKLLAARKVIEHEHALYGTKEMGHGMVSKRAEWATVTSEFCA